MSTLGCTENPTTRLKKKKSPATATAPRQELMEQMRRKEKSGSTYNNCLPTRNIGRKCSPKELGKKKKIFLKKKTTQLVIKDEYA